MLTTNGQNLLILTFSLLMVLLGFGMVIPAFLFLFGFADPMWMLILLCAFTGVLSSAKRTTTGQGMHHWTGYIHGFEQFVCRPGVWGRTALCWDNFLPQAKLPLP